MSHRVQEPRIKGTGWSFPPQTKPSLWVVLHKAHFSVLWFGPTFFTRPHLCKTGAWEPIFSLLFWHKPKFCLVVNLGWKNTTTGSNSFPEFAHLSLEIFAKKTSWGAFHEETKQPAWLVGTPSLSISSRILRAFNCFIEGRQGLVGKRMSLGVRRNRVWVQHTLVGWSCE